MLNKFVCCLGMLSMVTTTAGFGSPFSEGAFDTISISADDAAEDVVPGILHLRGHFLMHSDEWYLVAEQATVYGRVDKPDRMYLQGSPAHFQINKSASGTVQASAPEIEYLRSSDMLRLSGGAVLTLDQEVIRSTVINYDISTHSYRAGGGDGVTMEVPIGN